MIAATLSIALCVRRRASAEGCDVERLNAACNLVYGETVRIEAVACCIVRATRGVCLP
jgi:hypothetical protein